MPSVGIQVCLDLDGDFDCGAAEPATTTDASGNFVMSMAADTPLTPLLVAKIPANTDASAAAQGPYRLASRAKPVTAISALTTLDALRPRPAAAPVISAPMPSEAIPSAPMPPPWLGLAWTIDIHDPDDAEARRIGAAILPALAVAATRLVNNAAIPMGIQPATVLAARAAAQVLGAYIDPRTGTLLHTVAPRTLRVETLAKVQPETCATQPVIPISIRTRDAAPIDSKEVYVPAILQIGGTDAIATDIRGRGNSTWELMPKKPYRLKLGKKAALLGLPASKNWALLANYADKTLMRNALASCLSRMLGMDYTPAQRYVELTLNDDYVGVYQLSDLVEVANTRVNIGTPATAAVDPGMGFLLEIDRRLDETLWYYSPAGVPYTVKSDATAAQMQNLSGFINHLEGALFGENFKDPRTGYDAWLDADSLVDLYLINELFRNNDGFFSSTFAYRPRDGRLHFGPVWDFDIAAGNINYNGNDAMEGWWTRNQSAYVQRLLQDEQFERHLKVRWRYLAGRLPDLGEFAFATAAALAEPQARNFTRWPILDTWVWPNAVVKGSYAGELKYLIDWLSGRAGWMNGQLDNAP
ncbi:CotH kinase family protein [Variovorax robiniae]|uniref:CotH kinase family protein n=1 Tax=Variovorax robiniae TaxID=1836199 RepID=A0ABU8XGX4_9BURK